MEEVDRYYQGNITLEEAESYIASGMMTAVRAFVANGYYLRRIRDEKLYKESGYKNFKEYLEDRYKKDEGWASKCIKVNQQLSEGGNSPILDSRYRDYSDKYKLVELASMTEEQRTQVSPDMSVKALREFRKGESENLVMSQENQVEESELEVTDAVQEVATLETPEPEPEKLSAYDTPIKVYPADSLIARPGCKGGHDCFMCHLQCGIRQEYCRCVEATTGNPFPCEQIDRIDVLREEIGERCQFVDLDKAYHRAGDHEPIPCCKECKEPCQYACEISVKKREAEDRTPEPGTLYFTLENKRTIDGAYGACLAAVVRTYLDDLNSRGLHPMSDNIPDIEVRAMGLEYQVMMGHEFAEFEPDRGQTVIVERKRLQAEYEFWYPAPKPEPEPEPQPRAWIIHATPCIHCNGFSCTVPDDKKKVPGDGSNCNESCCWECTLHGACKLECNCSASRPEEPEPVPSEPDPVIDAEFKEVPEPAEELKSIGEMDLSSRTENILKRAGIDSVEKLISMSDEELTAVRGMSNRALEEIKMKLNELESADKADPEEFTTDLQVVRQMLEKENRLLSTCLLSVPDQNDIHIRQMKLRVAALAAFASDLDDIENPPPKPERIYSMEEIAKEIMRLEATYLGAPEEVKQSVPYQRNIMRLDAMRLLYDSMKGE